MSNLFELFIFLLRYIVVPEAVEFIPGRFLNYIVLYLTKPLLL
jgi:hypothetical protein